ncbi:CvpA family protein [Acinetobacter bereziniae]|uniref:CvpA family protein n=1 Tax=Acinetobacter bereziniae TaxID=106648 RepID=UPI0019009D3B|nr:CvpA family protein [Acinetobacter bereziniae]MBJ8451927.1 CvpA family protein [Acinetobacter bereziniae]MBJ8456219.1 CvpA family protein [Acinetobacter bereziniae]
MNTLDIIILIILLIGGLNGLRQGFVKAFANLIGWIFALIVGAKYANIIAPSMSALSQDPVVQKIAAFAFIVLVIIVLTWIATAILNQILKSLKLGPLNRLAGGALGTLKGLFIVLITMQGLGPWVDSSPTWKQSKFIQTLLPFAPLASEISKDAANEALNHIHSQAHSDDAAVRNTERSSTSEEDDQSAHSTKNPFY